MLGIASALVTASSLAAPGCVTPIVLLDEAKGLGAFEVERSELAAGVIDTHIVGIGLLYAGGRLSLGWCELAMVTVDSRSRSFAGLTSVGELTVGRRAEEIALAIARPNRNSPRP
jgi:hypothetical protein